MHASRLAFLPPVFGFALALAACQSDSTQTPTPVGTDPVDTRTPEKPRDASSLNADSASTRDAAIEVALSPSDAEHEPGPDAVAWDVAPSGTDAPRASDARGVSDGAPALCSRPTCGGDPTGRWESPAWCSRVEGSGTGVATLTFHANGTYEWLLLSSTLPRPLAKPIPETGTWKVSGNMLQTKITKNNGALYPPRGSLAYRGDIGASSLFCVTGDILTIQGEEKVGFNWQLRRRP